MLKKCLGVGNRFELDEVMFQIKDNKGEDYNVIYVDSKKPYKEEPLNTLINIKTTGTNGGVQYLHVWIEEKTYEKDLNKISNLYNRIKYVYKTEIIEIISFQYMVKTTDDTFGRIYEDLVELPKQNSNNVDTRVNITLRKTNSTNIVTYTLHTWLQSKVSEENARRLVNGVNMKNHIKKFLGTSDYSIDNVVYVNNKPDSHEYYGIFIDSVEHTPLSKKSEIIDNKNFDDLTDEELLNLKDRIDEVLFKREHGLTDEEYSFYLENEDIVKLEDVKTLYLIYKVDKFKIRKLRIKKILTEKKVVY